MVRWSVWMAVWVIAGAGCSHTCGLVGGCPRADVVAHCDAKPCPPYPDAASGGSATRACPPNWYHPGFDCVSTRAWARSKACAALEAYECQCGRGNCHFREGFEEAFVDAVEGGDGEFPSVPPRRYWANCFRTEAGHERAADWFDGYRAGLEVAEQTGAGRHRIATSTVWQKENRSPVTLSEMRR